jgi:hypothetical protein
VRRFADEAALEGGGHMLRLLPLLAPSSPAHVPFGSMPLLHQPRSRSEGTVPVRALTDKLLQHARNKSVLPNPPSPSLLPKLRPLPSFPPPPPPLHPTPWSLCMQTAEACGCTHQHHDSQLKMRPQSALRQVSVPSSSFQTCCSTFSQPCFAGAAYVKGQRAAGFLPRI